MSPESKFPFGNVSNFSNGCQSKKKHTHFQTMSETASFLLKAHEYEENGPPLSSRYFYKVNDFHLLVLKVFSKELSEQIDNAVENDLSNFYFSGTGDVEFRSPSGTKVTVKNSSRRNRMGTRSYERILQDNMTLKENKEILISENHMYVLVRDSRDTKWSFFKTLFIRQVSTVADPNAGDRSWGMLHGMEELNLRRALNQYCDSMVTRPDSKGQQSYVDVTCNITRSQDQCRDHALAGLNRVDLSKTDNAVARHRLNKKTLKDFYGGQGDPPTCICLSRFQGKGLADKSFFHSFLRTQTCDVELHNTECNILIEAAQGDVIMQDAELQNQCGYAPSKGTEKVNEDGEVDEEANEDVGGREDAGNSDKKTVAYGALLGIGIVVAVFALSRRQKGKEAPLPPAPSMPPAAPLPPTPLLPPAAPMPPAAPLPPTPLLPPAAPMPP